MFDYGNYKNVSVRYDAFIFDSYHERFEDNIAAFRSFLLSRNGYVRIEDTYHPDEFRLGYYDGDFDPEIHESLTAGQFTITFNCKPQRFLKVGEFPMPLDKATIKIYNPTNHIAFPLFRIYGVGTVNSRWENEAYASGYFQIEQSPSSGFTDVDCDLQEATTIINGRTVSRNSTLVVMDKFPVFKPGYTTLFLGLEGTNSYVIPRWWTI